MEKNRKESEKKFGEIRIMWSVIFLSSPLYVVIGYLAADRMRPVSVRNIELLKIVIYLFATTTLIASCYFRKMIIKGRGITASESEFFKNSPEQTPEIRYRNAILVSSGIANSACMYGLTLFFYTGDFRILCTVVAVSAVFIFFHRPRRDEFRQLLRSAEE